MDSPNQPPARGGFPSRVVYPEKNSADDPSSYLNASYTVRATCRVCGSPDLAPLFSLGEQYVSNFVPYDQVGTGPKCPIDLQLCRNCTLVQQRCTAPQELLYTRHYWYHSGITQTMRDALRNVTEAAERLVDLKPGDVVLDIGCNDGTLLRSYTAPGIYRVGVEPAENLQEEGSKGVDLLLKNFWSESVYSCAMGYTNDQSKARVITAIGCFYDLENPNQFIADVAKVLHPEGVFIAQLMCLKQMLALGDVGNLVHEHLEFYSLRSLETLFSRHGLRIFRIEENTVNGGSYRLYARHNISVKDVERNSVELFQLEEGAGLNEPETYRRWFTRSQRNRDRCAGFIRQQVAAGKRVWIYGASTKGNVLLQWYGLDCNLIGAAADRSPEKWGRYTIGTGIPIRSNEDFRAANPDYALVLPYAFREEFLQLEQDWRNKGGKFIFPLPEFEVV